MNTGSSTYDPAHRAAGLVRCSSPLYSWTTEVQACTHEPKNHSGMCDACYLHVLKGGSLVRRREPERSDVPEGFRKIDAYTNGVEIVVIGSPREPEEGEESLHNCDAMGCRSNHVLVRVKLDEQDQARLAQEDIE